MMCVYYFSERFIFILFVEAIKRNIENKLNTL